MTTDSSPTGSPRKLLMRSLILLVVVLAGMAYLFKQRKAAVLAEELKRKKEMEAGPLVKVAKAGFGNADKELLFIGEVTPFQSVTLYSKISGYINKILVDKGDLVKEGQLIADLISPEVDQAYKAGLADLENKRSILKRDQALLKKAYISEEEVQKTETDVKVAEANVKSLQEQQEYKLIKAPFSGTVIARFADPGALIQNATNSQTSAQPIATIAELHKIRLYIYVEQKDAGLVKVGTPVSITVAEKPQFALKASVTRVTGELDVHTHMMTTEIDVDNAKEDLTPGSYVMVHVALPSTNKLSVPSEALVVRGKQYFVPVVNDSNIVRFREIKVAENTGQKLIVIAGLKEGEKVALNVGERIGEGQKVRIDQ